MSLLLVFSFTVDVKRSEGRFFEALPTPLTSQNKRKNSNGISKISFALSKPDRAEVQKSLQ
jgi:hypothetical protein